MRTDEQIAEIKKRVSDPYWIDDFITKDEIAYLIDVFNKVDDKLHKLTGPITSDLDFSDPVLADIQKRIAKVIGEFTVTSAFFFKTTTPHIIHNDDTFPLPTGVYKGINLPLLIERDPGTKGTPKLCFFDQFYFHGPAKFFNGNDYFPTHYNKQIYEYSDVDGKVSEPFDEDLRRKYLSHLKREWLEGLSLWGMIDWVPGSALFFDSTRLHCASNFKKMGITSKLAISIFTKV